MIPINQKKVKSFNKNFKKELQKNTLVDFLLNNYIEYGYDFHRLFLHSGKIYALPLEILQQFLAKLTCIEIDNKQVIEQDLKCLTLLVERISNYERQLFEVLEGLDKPLTIEDLFNYLEFLNFNSEIYNISIDGKSYCKEILNSQFNHILDSFTGIVDIARHNNVSASLIESKKINLACNQIYSLEGFKNSLRNSINALCMELYKPEEIHNFSYENINYGTVFFNKHNPDYWSIFEKYRDLNQMYYIDKELDFLESEQLALKSGALRKPYGDDVLIFDANKFKSLNDKIKVTKSFRLLLPVYGSIDTYFIYNNKEYSIENLLNLYSSIYSYATAEKERIYSDFKLGKNISMIRIHGEKELMRKIQFDVSYMDLLNLLSFDLDSTIKSDLIHYKPLLKKGKIYYILPTWIEHVTIEKSIDKILSDKSQVEVILDNESDKGYLFENSIESFFRDSSIEFGKVKRDEEKGIPEIDGMFILDEYLFLFEAKASIKPETIMEAYNHLHSRLVEAQIQLDERVKLLTHNNDKLDLIESKSGLKIAEKKIFPFILVNHFYFNGYMELLYEDKSGYFPIIDFTTLQDIITLKKIPTWQYNEKTKRYNRMQLPCSTGKELSTYLTNQIKGLHNTETPTFQLTKDKLLFQIVKPLSY